MLQDCRKSSRKSIRFQNQNKEWLKQTIIATGIGVNAPSTSVSTRAIRRPKTSFCDLFTKNKRRRLNEEVK